MDLSIVDIKPTEEAATVRLQLDNCRADHEFQLYQIGLYAALLDDDGGAIIGETLFQIMQYDQPDIVRRVPHVSEFVVNTIFGQAKDVDGIIDPAAYVSIRQFRLALDSLIHSVMINELTLPLANDAGAELLTDGGIPIQAVYHPDKSTGILAALAALDGRLSGQIEQIAVDAGNINGRIAAAKAEAISEAGTVADAKIAAHDASEAAHPAHLSIVNKS